MKQQCHGASIKSNEFFNVFETHIYTILATVHTTIQEHSMCPFAIYLDDVHSVVNVDHPK